MPPGRRTTRSSELQIPGFSRCRVRAASLDSSWTWRKVRRTTGFPDVLPGGRAVLFRSSRGAARVVVVHSLETGERRDLVDGVSPLYVPTGYLVFGRAGSLWAAPFDLDALDLSGEPVPILDGVVMGNPVGGPGPPAQAAFTSTGSLVYVSGDPRSGLGRMLVWVNREGIEEDLPLPLRFYRTPRLSPSESTLAVDVTNIRERDIWVLDLARGGESRITFGGTNNSPHWSPSGAQLLFRDLSSNRLMLASSGGGGATDTLLDGDEVVDDAGASEAQVFPTSWASDGKVVALNVIRPDTARDLWVLPMEGDRTPVPFLVTPFNERAATFSPDGRWLAYVSDETGQDEVYVRAYPPESEQEYLASTGGGGGPVWSRNGRELFYQNGEQMMVVAIEAGEAFRPSPPELIFVC